MIKYVCGWVCAGMCNQERMLVNSILILPLFDHLGFTQSLHGLITIKNAAARRRHPPPP